MIEQFISTYGLTILYALLTAVAGVIGTWIGKIYKKYVDDKTKASVVTTCCKAVEQLYRDLDGPAKYYEAVQNITAMLNLKGITVTELEIKMLIEATCSEFAHKVKAEIATPEAVTVGQISDDPSGGAVGETAATDTAELMTAEVEI